MLLPRSCPFQPKGNWDWHPSAPGTSQYGRVVAVRQNRWRRLMRKGGGSDANTDARLKRTKIRQGVGRSNISGKRPITNANGLERTQNGTFTHARFSVLSSLLRQD